MTQPSTCDGSLVVNVSMSVSGCEWSIINPMLPNEQAGELASKTKSWLRWPQFMMWRCRRSIRLSCARASRPEYNELAANDVVAAA